MKPPSQTGMSGAGPPSKKSQGGRTDHRLGRRSRLLSVADGGTHLGPTRTDAGAAGATDARPPLSYQWDHARWATVPASAPSFLRCTSSGRLPARALA